VFFICIKDPHDEALVEQETTSTGCPFYDSVSFASSGIIPISQSQLSTRLGAFSPKDLIVQQIRLVISFPITTERAKPRDTFSTSFSALRLPSYDKISIETPISTALGTSGIYQFAGTIYSNHHIGRLTVTLRSAKIRSIMGFSLLSPTALLFAFACPSEPHVSFFVVLKCSSFIVRLSVYPTRLRTLFKVHAYSQPRLGARHTLSRVWNYDLETRNEKHGMEVCAML